MTYTVVSYPGFELPREYVGFVYTKWTHSLRAGNDYFKLIDPPTAFYAAYKPYVEATLGKPNAVVRLARLTDDPDVLLGFSVTRGSVLDYVYVIKPHLTKDIVIDYRRKGIGKALVPDGIDTITHLTRMGLTIWGGMKPKLKFNPFA